MLSALVGANASQTTRSSFRRMLGRRTGGQDVEIETTASGIQFPLFSAAEHSPELWAPFHWATFSARALANPCAGLKVRDARSR